MKEVKRYISCWEKEGEELIKKLPLPDDISLTKLQELFSVPPYNPMYDEFDLETQHVGFFKKYKNLEFNFELYSYSLSCSVK